jgi:hypothetical protein
LSRFQSLVVPLQAQPGVGQIGVIITGKLFPLWIVTESLAKENLNSYWTLWLNKSKDEEYCLH